MVVFQPFNIYVVSQVISSMHAYSYFSGESGPRNCSGDFSGKKELLYRNLVLPDKEHNIQNYPVAGKQLFPCDPV